MRRPSWLRWPWVSAEWADTLQARADRLESERDDVYDRLADATTANRRVHDRNLELSRRLRQVTEAGAGEWKGRAQRAEKRVEHLKKELDKAAAS